MFLTVVQSSQKQPFPLPLLHFGPRSLHAFPLAPHTFPLPLPFPLLLSPGEKEQADNMTMTSVDYHRRQITCSSAASHAIKTNMDEIV